MNELKEQILGAIKDLCPDKSAQGSRDYIEFLIDQYTTRKELEARLDEMYALKSYSVPMYGIVMGRSSENYEWRITQLSTELTNKEKEQ